MKIVIQNSDGKVVMVANCAAPIGEYTVYDLPGWDWSKADLTGVNTNELGWVSQLKWNGTTLVKK